jgi:hypothetical protein
MNETPRPERNGLFPAGLAALFVFLSLSAGTGLAQPLQRALHRGREVAAREVLVKFRGAPGVAPTPDELQVLADADRDEEVGRLGVRRLRSRSLDVAGLIAALQQRGDVEYAEPNYIVHAIGTVANDTYFAYMWGLRNTGQLIGSQYGVYGADIGATLAWDITKGSKANVVAVIDTGIDYTHPDLQANVWSAPASFSVRIGGRTITCAAGTHGFNAITSTCDPRDDNSHGTHVSGTIGAVGNNGAGVTGVNWVASLMSAKFLDATGSGTVADAINAIEFTIQAKQAFGAAANVRVLSNSWAGGGFSQALLDEINKANASDMLFVAAAGNDGTNNDAVASYPANYNAPNVVAVAATDNRDQLASFSNYGAATVELGAPGVYIASTLRNGVYGYYSGTSMAAPHVSGAAALILSACTLNTLALRDVILNTVDPVPALVGKTVTGGRLNVFDAVRSCSSPVISSFTSSVASPYPASGFSPITWTVVAQGTAPLEYQFTRRLGAAAPVVSLWGASNTFTWTPATGDAGTWTVSVAVRTAGATVQTTASATFVLTMPGAVLADFTGNRRSDILWHNATQGEVWLWPMDGASRVSETYVGGVADTSWRIRGVGDQTGDGKADILWRNDISGMVYLWPMDGSTVLSRTYVGTVDPAYDIVGTGDFDGDGKWDILWRNLTTGDAWIWLMNGATPLSQVFVGRVDPGYAAAGVGDLDGDGKADIVWRHSTLGEVWVWQMNGTTRVSATPVATVPDLGYQVAGVADFTGDGRADILWHHATTGEVWLWPMNGSSRTSESYVGTVPDTGYRIRGTGDYNGDAKADVLWHHATSGEVWIWLMDGTTPTAAAFVATVPDVGYQIVK